MNKTKQLCSTPLPDTQFIGQHILYQAVCASTNDVATQRLVQGALPEGTVIITDHQYQGRGQRGRMWHSQPYQNLTFSVILYPTFLGASQGFTLNIITALALHQVLAAYVPSALAIKWPNDIYHQDQKLSGVLIENVVAKQQLKASVIGIGLNVNQTQFIHGHYRQKPTSLAGICGHTFDLQLLLSQLLAALEHHYLQLKAQGIAGCQVTYLEKMYWRHEVHTFQDAVHTFQAKVRSIDAVGQLVLERADGTCKAYGTKEVVFVA